MEDGRELWARNRDERGFTLIELLMIIMILGVLMSFVVFAVGNLTTQTAAAACQSDFKTVETAQEAYTAQVGTPAGRIADLRQQKIGLDGLPVGPWLKDDVGNARLYVIGIDDGKMGGRKGDVTVKSVSPPHLPKDGSANCSYE